MPARLVSSVLFCLLITPVLGTPCTWALDVAPFFIQNQSPLIQIFGLPAAESAALVSPQRLASRLALTIGNNFTSDARQQEAIGLDGETYRLQLALRYGLMRGLEIGVDVPYIAHCGGVFDAVIEAWHDALMISQGGRTDVDRGRLQYVYFRNGDPQLDVNDSTSGLADMVLSVGIELYRDATATPRLLAVRAGVKVPTGSSDELQGSGSTDGSVRLLASDSSTLSRYNLTLLGSVGTLFLSRGEVLADQQRHVVGFGSLTIGWHPLAWLIPKLQVDWHSPFYDDSQLRQLASWSAQLTIGATIRLPGDVLFDLGVAEDIVPTTAPDVAFHFALRKTF